MADKDSSSRKEPSDLFKVDQPTPSLAPVDKIVLPPAEALKRRIRRFIAAGIAAVIFFLIAHFVLGLIRDARLASALDEVIDDASPETIENALSLLRSEPDPSVRARLLATAALGGDGGKLKEAEAALEENAAPDDPDQRVARIYVLLAKGDARAAHAEAERTAKYTDQADAFLRGRAMTAVARGQWGQALEDAEAVVAARPGAPEPAALLARVKAETEGPEAALAALDELSRDTSATKIARARVLASTQTQAEEALSLADDVLGDDGAAVVHEAWAHYVKGLVAFRKGAIGDAYAHARAAGEPDLRVDEPLLVQTAQLLLALGRTSEAKRLLTRLTSGPSADLFTRTHVIAWWYAQSGDMRAGLATLTGAGFGPDKEAKPALRALVIAELLKGSPRSSEQARAASLYREAASDPDWGVVASNALANDLLERGETEEALEVIEAGLAANPNHLMLVDTAARAHIDAEQVSEAHRITKSALEAFANEGWAHGSHARMLLAKGEFADALAALDTAVELSPHDAQLFALRGDAARNEGATERAKESYEKALQLDASEPRALSGFVALLIDMGLFPRAAEIIKQMDEAKVRDLRADEQRIRYLVRTGAGQSGMSTVRSAVSRHSKNVPLRLAAARACLQAEDYTRAGVYFQQAKRNGADARMAETGLALAQVLGRRKLGAENSLERALEAVDEEGKRLEAGPEVQVWELIVKARLALADEKRGLAVRYAKQAAAIRPDDADVHILQADIEEDRERSPEEALRSAVAAPIPMPIAAGRLAVLLGPTDEGCELGAVYLKANRNGKQARKARDLRRECAK